MTRDEYLKKSPWTVVEMFLHERYGDCMEDRTAADLEARLAEYGHYIATKDGPVEVTYQQKT